MELLQKEYVSSGSDSEHSKEEVKVEAEVNLTEEKNVGKIPAIIKVDLAPEVDITDLMLE